MRQVLQTRMGHGLTAVAAIILVLALTGTGAQASGARIASACPKETVNGANVGKLTLRFVLIGRVSCDKARRLARAYFNKRAAGQCGKQNNFCVLQFPGGWDCSIFFAAESQETGGATAGCAQTGAKIRLYKATNRGIRRPQATYRVRSLSSPRVSLASVHFRSCRTSNALHVGIDVYHVSCASSRRIVGAYLHHERAGGGFQRVKGFRRWTCSTGDGSGSCAKGKIDSGVPEINFFYLDARG